MFSTAICVLCFVLGTLSGWYGCMSYKKAQDAALKAADKVMDNNQLFDIDGRASVVDSLNKLEQ